MLNSAPITLSGERVVNMIFTNPGVVQSVNGFIKDDIFTKTGFWQTKTALLLTQTQSSHTTIIIINMLIRVTSTKPI